MAEIKTCREKFLETKDELNQCSKNLQEIRETFRKEIEKRTKFFIQQMQKYSKMDDLDEQLLNELSEELSGKPLDQENVPGPKRRGRKKKVLSENTEANLQNVKIKMEKISMESQRLTSCTESSVCSTTENHVSSSSDIPIKEIKKEQVEMPAPSWIPPKKNNKEIKPGRSVGRPTRTKGKSGAVRDSDVIVQCSAITTITLSDTDESESDKATSQKEIKSRSTRTKTKKAQTEIDSGAETDTDSIRSTRTKTRNKKEEEKVEIIEESRSTRTKTIRKGKKLEEENEKDEPDEKLPETRSTRTKTIKKGAKELEESTTSNTKSASSNKVEEDNQKDEPKTIKKGAKELEESTISNTDSASSKNAKQKNESEETGQTTKTMKKGTKESEESTKSSKATNKDTESTKDAYLDKPVPKKNDKVAVESKKKETVEAFKTKGATNKPGKAKRNRSHSLTDDDTNDKKRSKSISPVEEVEENATVQTVYEDARSTVGGSQENNHPPLNATYVAEAPTINEKTKVSALNSTVTLNQPTSNAANCTMVLDKPQFNIFAKDASNSLFTDDDSVEMNKTPPKKAPATKAGKEVFSPYEKTTLKKKVEAFEKLQNVTEIPVKCSTNVKSKHGTPSSVREKAKMFTPASSRFIPNSCSTSKISRLIGQQHNSTNNESLLAIKSAQKESREKQKKLLEREQAQKKKEAMLSAQAEAKRRLNEEKQLKALQQRKAIEAEKLKQLEIQKQKEAKIKQREQEREEYLQKQKLELEKKRVAQKKKVAEMQAQRQQILEEQARNPPVYMTTKLPKLPTEDCYDSDDPDYKKVQAPHWCGGNYAKRNQFTMLAAGEKIKNTLFCRHAQTPDLIEIFEVIDPKKLKRSSSILWRKPPRYTMMPNLDDTKFDEDEELYESD